MNKYEKKIRRIGGALLEDYRALEGIVGTINSDYFPLFKLMGFNSPEYTSLVLDTLLSSSFFTSAKEAYIGIVTERIKKGELKIENILSKKIIRKEYTSEKEREEVHRRELHRALAFQYNKMESEFRKLTSPFLGGFNKFPIKVCRDALSVTSYGLIIDAERYINIYGDYMEANNSQTGRLHIEAASAINSFFGGDVEVTEKELRRYFIIENGIVKPNPSSINKESYMRVGYRGKSLKK